MTEPSNTRDNSEITREQPILVATDFSEDSRSALLWACDYAEGIGAQLVILHVVHDLAAHPGFYASRETEHLEPMQDVAETMMDEFLAPLRTGIPEIKALANAELKFVPGLPPSRIVEVAGLLSAGLIAIGSRGLTCLPHKLLGATSERVAELSTIPVVIVKSQQNRTLGKKEIRQKEKRLKKDRKRLKKLLGVASQEDTKGRVSE